MKAQSSLEFMVMVGIFMVVFLVFFAAFGDRFLDFQRQRDAEVAEDILFMVESEILITAGAHDGYSRGFQLPPKIAGHGYNITYNNSEVYIDYFDQEYVRSITVNMSSASILLGPGNTNYICKFGSVVFLNHNCP